MKKRTLARGLAGIWWVTLVFLYAPLLVIVLFSFNSANSTAVFENFSLAWYRRLFGNEQIISAFGNSLVLAVSSSVVALVVGCLIGYGMYRHRHRKLGWLIVLIYLPIVLPDIVFGISEMAFFVQIHEWTGLLQPGLGTMIIAHVTFQIPFVALIVYSRFVGLDPTLFEAAKDLYASPVKRVVHFMVPTIKPALISAFFLSFTLSIDDFVISFFTAGPESATLPIYIWSAIKKGVTPEINAIATLMIGAVAMAAILSMLFNRQGRR
ncbi:ABC transporter permease [Chromohalobacter israelensis]|uniref:Binding-protein-dependent transport systems inner membrane component n=1 Tax=Chromohalobacter israelensis (strain ATCC BAA-138 / DSM 3043 / CIP 106854 / NCIMB 13768 / 1H11) TaxID=290398 RepID=Q1QYA8_CHRI1|nr:MULTISPECIES: ABC transporter permease [Chromohalobacter]ABE58550.1 binding-protein-dependent transport systems inner membrane component [Chromohalobacter salexigens DSM 3043]MBZ5875400.1 ABC transporter permease [Chromohalobacter salexigens]MDF9432979.1 ABC transporter permease [Chromohalobacter israelensis]MDO0944672.1 ABC transporter permease [Chromohalobacter salexigens]